MTSWVLKSRGNIRSRCNGFDTTGTRTEASSKVPLRRCHPQAPEASKPGGCKATRPRAEKMPQHHSHQLTGTSTDGVARNPKIHMNRFNLLSPLWPINDHIFEIPSLFCRMDRHFESLATVIHSENGIRAIKIPSISIWCCMAQWRTYVVSTPCHCALLARRRCLVGLEHRT